MTLPTVEFSREQMEKRVARFDTLRGFDGGLPDSYYPGAERTLYNIISPPLVRSAEQSLVPPSGLDAAANAAIEIAEGFNLGVAQSQPGKGPMMHNHDTNETFMPLTGRWRVSWETGGRTEYFDLGRYDVISVPPGVQRRFENITHEEPDATHLLLVVIAGNHPQAEFSPEARAELLAKGYMSASGQAVPRDQIPALVVA
jgi:mannose-6-phosphate isomerase-like protein (cupin superfamily)